MRALLIAEKPDLMRKIEACYKAHPSEVPYSITFTAQRGHLVTLKKPDELDEELKEWSWDTLPIVPEQHGGWQYQVIKEKKTGNYMTSQERYDEIKKELLTGKYDFVINAGDPDQEGELLVRIVLEHMKNKLPVKRFWTNDLTESHILHALQNLRDDDHDPMLKNLLAAAYGRQHSDYRFGMNLSRAATLKMGARVACGRVKTPILAIVCKREEEIENFKPKTTYGVQAMYTEGFAGSLINNAARGGEEDEDENDGIIWFDKKEEALNLIKSLGNRMEVVSYEGKRKETQAPKLFKLATAQIEAGKMGYSAADTLRILQSLYEQKYLSYPRTGCEYLGGEENFNMMLKAAAAVPSLKAAAEGVSAKDIARVRGTKTWVNASALEDEGHSALVPTGLVPEWEDMDTEEQDIYSMVCRQFLAPFLPPLVQDKAELVAKEGENYFRSTGTVLVSPGWTDIFERQHRDNILPRHDKGDILTVETYSVTEKTTKCPKSYTTADLIAVCEAPLKFLDDESLRRVGKKLHIGTPATRASIIEELINKDKYLKKTTKKRREVVVPTKIGREIIDNIGTCDICKVDLTAEWEEKLEKVRLGKLSLAELEDGMKEHVAALVEDFKHRDMRPLETDAKFRKIGTCPVCGKDLVQGPTKIFCAGYKENGCKAGGFREKHGAVITGVEFLEMAKGKHIFKEMQQGAVKWKQEIACDPKTLRIIYISNEKDSDYSCPICGEPVLELPNAWCCAGYKKKTCNMYVSKSFGNRKTEISRDQFKKLFTTGQTDVIDGFISKEKKTEYSARLVADKKEGRIVPKFADKEIPTNLTCPVCNRKLVSRGFRFVCTGDSDGSCAFSMYNTENKQKMSEERAKRLLDAVKDGRIGGRERALITDGDVPTPWTCPSCGKKIVRNGMRFTCSGGCGFSLYRDRSGHLLSDKEVAKFMTDGKTDVIRDFLSKKGTFFSARLVYDRQTNSTEFVFEDVSEESDYDCPFCGKRMKETKVKLTCSCGFELWKNQGSVELTDSEIRQLFKKGRTGYRNMVSKAKPGKPAKPFTARISLDMENKRTKFTDFK